MPARGRLRLGPMMPLASGVAGALLLGACGGTAPPRVATVHPAPPTAAPPSRAAQVDYDPPVRHLNCRVPGAAARADHALAAARARYRLEARGSVIHVDLAGIARDRALIDSLRSGLHDRALAAARRLLVNHVVRIRVLEGVRVLVDANSTSFDVAGAYRVLRGPGGRRLGLLHITVQDVIGFVKLAIRRGGADAVLVRGSQGRVVTSLPALVARALPRRGCLRLGAAAYVVRSFTTPGFTDPALRIWVLVAA